MTRTMIYAVTALVAVLLLIGGASAAQITIGNIQVNEGGTVTADVILDAVPANGLSGYAFDINIVDPAKAQITAVTFNSSLGGLTDRTTPPFTTGSMTWADTAELVQDTSAGQTITLATITFAGLSSGSTVMDNTLTDLTSDTGELFNQMGYTINDPTITVYGTPGALFTFLPASPLVGDTVTFTDGSTGIPTSWDMDFGDGSAHSYVAGPWTHAYSSAGTYPATLTVNNPVGPSSSVSHDVVVTTMAAPVADFSVSATSGLPPVSASFTDQSTGTVTSYNWEYRLADNGAWTQFSTAQSPSNVPFDTFGMYDIRLTVSNEGGSNTLTKTHVFQVIAASEPLTPVTSGTVSGGLFIASPTVYSNKETTQTFTLPTYTDIQWARLYVNTYGGSSSATNFQQSVDFNGIALATETYNQASSGDGKSYPVNDHVTKVYSDFEAWYDVTDRITSTSPVVHVTTYNAQPIKGVTLVVAYNDGDSDVVKYWVNHGHLWTSPGSGSTVFDTSSVTSGWTSATSTIREVSSADGTYTFNGVAKAGFGSSGQYQGFNIWDVTNDITAGSPSTLAWTKSGSLKETVATMYVRYVTKPTADFTVSKANPVTTSDVLTFTSTSTIPATNNPATYLWDFGDGTTDSTSGAVATHTFSTAATYTVTLTVTNEGGSSTATTSVVATDLPIISFVPTSQTFMPSESRTYDIIMDQAPQGLAGYDMVVTLANGAPADIVAVSYPSWAQMTLAPTVPADSVRIGAVDTNQQVTPGAENVVLATITVRGTTTGTTAIQMSSLTMTGEYGVVVTSTLVDGEAIISTYAGPVAGFTGTPTSGPAPLTVAFDSTSSTGPITTYQWDFDNNGIIDSTAQNPTHEYTAPGTYTVKLTVSGPGGSNTLVRNSYITAQDTVPTAAFDATPTSGTKPLTVTFTDQSTGPVTAWAWDFNNDGITDSVQQNPVKTFTIAGTYTVKLTVSGPGGSDTETKADLITVNNAGPTADFIANPTSGHAPLTVAFSDQSTGGVTSWAWDFDNNGVVDSTDQNPTHEFAAGTHTVKLTVTGPGGSSDKTRTDYIVATGLTADFTANRTSGVASRNVSLDVQFTDASTGYPTGATGWAWNLGNGQTSTEQNPTTAYTGRPQTFTVTLTASNSADTDSETKVQFISITPYLEVFPGGYTNLPTDLDADYVYEDINGNGRIDYDDVVAFYVNMDWIRSNYDVDIENYDYNFNGMIDFDDVVVLNDMILYG